MRMTEPIRQQLWAAIRKEGWSLDQKNEAVRHVQIASGEAITDHPELVELLEYFYGPLWHAEGILAPPREPVHHGPVLVEDNGDGTMTILDTPDHPAPTRKVRPMRESEAGTPWMDDDDPHMMKSSDSWRDDNGIRHSVNLDTIEMVRLRGRRPYFYAKCRCGAPDCEYGAPCYTLDWLLNDLPRMS